MVREMTKWVRRPVAATALAAVMAGIAAGAALMGSAPTPAAAQDRTAGLTLPNDARPGTCFAPVFVPGDTRQVPRRVLVQEESEQVVITPAEYRWVEREVELETAAERIEVTPARFETQTRTVIIEPERRIVTVEPAVYETVTEPVMVRDSYTDWRPGCQALETVERAAGDVMCRVTVPAAFRDVERRVLKEPARLSTRIIPAKTEDIQVRVMVERPRRRVITIPAVTRTFRVMEEVTPMRREVRRIPPVFETVMETVKVGEGRIEMRTVLCDAGLSRDLVRALQSALEEEGFDPGPIDGIFGSGTRSALNAFQSANGLAEGGVSDETLEALGVEPDV